MPSNLDRKSRGVVTSDQEATAIAYRDIVLVRWMAFLWPRSWVYGHRLIESENDLFVHHDVSPDEVQFGTLSQLNRSLFFKIIINFI